MNKHFITLISALMFGGGIYAQSLVDEKKPVAYMVSDAHLDTQWNWDIQTTIKEYVWNTLNQNLFLLKKYPNYIFNFEGGIKYSWMKEYYPQQFELLKKYISNGRWHISGASWDATDTLVPSVESAIRNILLGQNFYRTEFGVESTDIFLPDCFGFGWTLPSIASHCGLIGFSSQKLQWRSRPFYGNEKYPFTVGLWKGIDGSSIMMTHGYDYNQWWKDEDLSCNQTLLDLTKKSPLNMVYRYYGTGDIGGSPSIESVRAVEKGLSGNGPLKIVSASSDQIYKDFLPYKDHPELPNFEGELLMDVHGTGCYTSQAAMKLYNRQNELLGDAAERASVVADWLNQIDYPRAALTKNWQQIIFHQFHDDLTGTSIPRAYEFSWNDELIGLKNFSGILTSSIDGIIRKMDTRVKGIPVVIYNALGFDVSDIAEIELSIPKKPKGIVVYDMNGSKVASQLISYLDGKAKILVDAVVPSTGCAVYDVRISNTVDFSDNPIHDNVLENSVYSVKLNSNGDIISLYDKRNHRELVRNGQCIRLALFDENKSYSWPAWEVLKSTIDREAISITDDVKITVVENGSLRKALCIEKKYKDSYFKQYIRLYEGSRAERIDFYNEIDWHTSNALLKAEFPLNIENKSATYDLGLGSIERGNNTDTAYEVYAQYWANLTDKTKDYNVTIMNDSKYGWDKPNNHTLRLTLLHTPETTTNYVYQNCQDFGYHSFTYSLVAHSGDLNKAEVVRNAEVLNQKLKAFETDKHDGVLGKSLSFVSCNNPNVIIKALKKAENSDDYVIRVYEQGGEGCQRVVLSFAGDILEAYEADGTEKSICLADFKGKEISFSINPFSIKTFKLRLKSSDLEKYTLEHQFVSLPFDKKCSSFNEFRGDADFSLGYSYAAELLPEALVVNQIPFKLGEKDSYNGLLCNGNEVPLPKNNEYNKFYFLAAATDADYEVAFKCGNNIQNIIVPSYTGFVGQWGHLNHTIGYLKEAEVAYVGTHQHSVLEDEPYKFTYMFKFCLDIPKGATSIILPHNNKIVLFAATLVKEDINPVRCASSLFNSAIRNTNEKLTDMTIEKENLMNSAKIIGYSGFFREEESPEHIIDGKADSKWCEANKILNYVDVDLGEEKSIGTWRLINAGSEDKGFITSNCFLLSKKNINDEWEAIDHLEDNKSNVVVRKINGNVRARYIRLMVTQPMQAVEGRVMRINELEVYE